MSESAQPLSRLVRYHEVGEEGLDLAFAADGAQREALAKHLGIPEVAAFSAQMTVERWRRDGLVVRGQIDAEVVQSCVVTLDPVRNAVHERFENYFAPRPDIVETVPEGLEPVDVEPLVGERLDAAALAVEHLVLALDPYPRCEGVAFELGDDAQEDEKTKPFASLAALRRGRD